MVNCEWWMVNCNGGGSFQFDIIISMSINLMLLFKNQFIVS